MPDTPVWCIIVLQWMVQVDRTRGRPRGAFRHTYTLMLNKIGVSAGDSVAWLNDMHAGAQDKVAWKSRVKSFVIVPRPNTTAVRRSARLV